MTELNIGALVRKKWRCWLNMPECLSGVVSQMKSTQLKSKIVIEEALLASHVGKTLAYTKATL